METYHQPTPDRERCFVWRYSREEVVFSLPGNIQVFSLREHSCSEGRLHRFLFFFPPNPFTYLWVESLTANWLPPLRERKNIISEIDSSSITEPIFPKVFTEEQFLDAEEKNKLPLRCVAFGVKSDNCVYVSFFKRGFCLEVKQVNILTVFHCCCCLKIMDKFPWGFSTFLYIIKEEKRLFMVSKPSPKSHLFHALLNFAK